jgi:hypothetical protein
MKKVIKQWEILIQSNEQWIILPASALNWHQREDFGFNAQKQEEKQKQIRTRIEEKWVTTN